jgi:HK97 gp10 family phage protein
MSADVKITYKGIPQLKKALDALPKEMQRSAYRSVITAGARVIAKKAKQKAPRESGLLKKSIGIKFKREKKTSPPMAFIGPRRGMDGEHQGEKRNPVRYAHLVELGTPQTSAQPFIRPAVDSSEGEVFSKMSAMLDKAIAKASSKIQSKVKR